MAYDLGDPVPLSFEVLSAAGVRTNATAVTLTITLPDGTTASPSVTNPPATTGLYRHDYAPTQSGRHLVRWVATGPAAAYTDAFDVRPAAPALIVSLADVKRQLNKSSDDTVDDDELREYVEATTAIVEEVRGEAVVRRAVVEDIELRCGTTAVLLGKRPIISLTSVATVDAVTTWAVADLHVSKHGIVTVQSGPAFYGLVRFTYVAGYAVIPANFSLAAKIIIAHLWETQQPALARERWGAPGPFGARGGEAGEFATSAGLGYAVPNRALELLGKPGPQVA